MLFFNMCSLLSRTGVSCLKKKRGRRPFTRARLTYQRLCHYKESRPCPNNLSLPVVSQEGIGPHASSITDDETLTVPGWYRPCADSCNAFISAKPLSYPGLSFYCTSHHPVALVHLMFPFLGMIFKSFQREKIKAFFIHRTKTLKQL